MPSKRETVLGAVKALVASALPGAEVKRNLAKPERIPPGGLVVIRDGDPGEPDVTLSPVSYLYTHRIPVEIAAFESATLTREEVLDGMLPPSERRSSPTAGSAGLSTGSRRKPQPPRTSRPRAARRPLRRCRDRRDLRHSRSLN